MNYKHLTIDERACIYRFEQLGMSMREIAKALDRNVSTISREFQRNKYYTNGKHTKSRYSAKNAQEKYKERRKKCQNNIKINNKIKEYIEDKLFINWSPEQLVNYKDKKPSGMPSVATIYRWINKGLLINGDKTRLRRKGKFKRPTETRGRFNIGKTIKKRPKEVYKRKTFGHWEADTVVSGKTNNYELKSKYCFVTIAERKSRLYLCKHIPDRKEETVTQAIIELLQNYPKELVQTITCDRGKEFAGYKKIEEELGINMYFADPYCAWQKGTNENSNGLLREYYPKGMDLSKTNSVELKKKLDLLNNRPRKCINYKTPNEVINDFILECCT